MLRIKLLTLLLVSVYCLETGAAVKNETYSKIDLLMEKQEYQAAIKYIQELLPNSQDKSYLYLKFSQSLAELGSPEAYKCFYMAMSLLPKSNKSETLKPEVEQILDIASWLRTNNGLPVAKSILNGLRDKYPDYSSIYYGMANLASSESRHGDFFENYYKAFQLNTNNARALPGYAINNSNVTKAAPQVNEFPWLNAATVFYDNQTIWTIVFRTLHSFDMLKDSSNIDMFAKGLPLKIKKIFYYQYYKLHDQHDSAVKEVKAMLPLVKGDFRYDLCRRLLFIDSGFLPESIENMTLEPKNIYHKFRLFEFWLTYDKYTHFKENGLDNFEKFMACIAEATSELLTRKQIITNNNYFISGMIRMLANERKPDDAIALLIRRQNELDWKNLQSLASFYISANEYQKAIEIMKIQLDKSPDDIQHESIQRIIDYAVLSKDWQTARHYLKQLKSGKEPFPAEYQGLKPTLLETNKKKKKILKVPGYLLMGEQDWCKWNNIGPCFLGSNYSLMTYWQMKFDYEKVEEELAGYDSKLEPIFNRFINRFYEAHGFDFIYIAPSKSAVIHLLDNDIPVMLNSTSQVGGKTITHVRTIYAYDNQLNKFFARDTNTTGESRLNYDDLYEAIALRVVVPKSKSLSIKIVTDKIKQLSIPLGSKLLTPDIISRLKNYDLSLEYWSNLVNGHAQLLLKDYASCINSYNNVLAVRQPNVMSFYEWLAAAYINNNQPVLADKIIEMGLEKFPDSLKLIQMKIERTINKRIAAGEKTDSGPTDQQISDELIELTKHMESVNPDYPITYSFRGNIYAATKRYWLAGREYEKFLMKYNKLSELWKYKYRKHYLSAQDKLKQIKLIVSKSK